MSKKHHVSETPATKWLKNNKIAFTEYQYEYIEHGGAPEAAKQLGVNLHQIAKTLVMQDEQQQPLIVLMHGDCEVSTKNLARQIGVKKVTFCSPEVAQRNSGYMVGGTSPFGTRKNMPIWVQKSLLEYTDIYLNGGRRGYMLSIKSQVLINQLGGNPVDVSNETHNKHKNI